MEVTINIIEAASELADLAVKREICNNESLEEGDEDWNKVYQWDESKEVTSYTEQAQDLFNISYDYYFEILINCSTDAFNKL